MKAIILVGGEGTRLRPLTYKTIKPMVPVVNRPFLEHLFGFLNRSGVRDIILALGYMPEQIQQYFGDGERFGMRITYSVESEPLGTAGAVKNAEKHLDSTFMVLNGDVLSSFDLKRLLEFHTANKAIATLGLTMVDNPSAFGVVLTDSKGRVSSFIEKPKLEEAPSNFINAGVYILEPSVLEYLPKNVFCMFERDVFPVFLRDGFPVYAYNSNAYWLDMGTPEKYLKLNEDMLSGNAGEFHVPLLNGTLLGRSTKISKDAVLKGPIVIGDYCEINAGVSIEGPCVLGNRCHIETGATITGSVLWDDVKVGVDAVIQKSIVGKNCIIGEKVNLGIGCVVGSDAVIKK